MKKIYFQPNCMIVELGTCKVMATSLPQGDEEIEDSSEILTKELNTNGSSGKNIWDEEW